MNGTPRILLAEDDPVSLAFLASVLQELGCEVEAVADGDAAERAASTHPFDLLVFDHRMPALEGDRVLEITRANPDGQNRDTPAIVTTADPDPQLHQRLRDAGFQLVLLKPSSKSRLREALQGLGLARDASESAVLDDEVGLAASGSEEILAALRSLFATELDTIAHGLDALLEDRIALGERLHRLCAACGFCGAMALKAAAAELSDALHKADRERIAVCSREFRVRLAATRAALGG
ncbi:MAG: response regulator [Rhodanobacteraceae bacterium]